MAATVQRQIATSSKTPSFVGRLVRAFVKLVLLVIVVVLGVVLGIVLYWGIYTTVLLPIQSNAQAIAALDQALQAERDNVTQELARRDARLADVETALVEQQRQVRQVADDLQETQARLVTVEEELRSGLSQVQSDLGRLQEQVAALSREAERTQGHVRNLQADLARLESDLAGVGSQIEDLQAMLDQQALELNAMSSDIADLQQAVLAPHGEVARLQRTAQLLRAEANLLNAQREFLHRNFGLAVEYLQRTRDTVAALAEATGGEEQAQLLNVVTLLDEALDVLETDPFAAAAALDAAWRALDAAVR